MALPIAKEARPFYQAAWQRLEDSQILLENERFTAAVYLMGYAVECMLKALVLTVVAKGKRLQILESFRGSKAHDYEWLKRLYLRYGGSTFPLEIRTRFARINTWTTDMRYQPRQLKKKESYTFMTEAEYVVHWADGRL